MQPFAPLPSDLVSSEALGQDPVVDVAGKTGEGAVDDFRGARLGDSLPEGFGVAAVCERKELPVDGSSHLRGESGGQRSATSDADSTLGSPHVHASSRSAKHLYLPDLDSKRSWRTV